MSTFLAAGAGLGDVTIALVPAIIAAAGSCYAAYLGVRNRVAVKDVHSEVNGRLSEAVEAIVNLHNELDEVKRELAATVVQRNDSERREDDRLEHSKRRAGNGQDRRKA